MNKFIAVLLVLCLVFMGAVGYMLHKNDTEAEAPVSAETPAAGETPLGGEAESAEPIEIRVLDYEAIYALHDKDEVVMTVDGRDVAWSEYFYLLYSQAERVSKAFRSMAENYGVALDWEDGLGEDSEDNYLDLTIDSTEDTIRQFATIEAFARENGVELTEQNLADIDARLQQEIVSTCGEGATEQDFEEYIKDVYMTRDMYDRVNRLYYLSQQNFIQVYGENGELIGDETAMQYLEDNRYISANHILFMTIDPATGEALDEDAINAKKAQADKLVEELRAIEDKEELKARFKELKEEYCEDTGKAAFPDGYIFLPGMMVPEFENGCLSLEEYQVSEPVESGYGFHIILRLPLDVNGVIEYSDAGIPLTARSKASDAEYNSRMQSIMEGLGVEYAEGFDRIDLLSYLR